MIQEYFVAEITKRGWQRISQNYANVREAQATHHRLKAAHPNACVIVDTSWKGDAVCSRGD